MSGRLLIVDDDPDAIEVIARLFARDGFDVHRAESHSDAMFQIVSADPGFDGVLLMFGASGPDAATKLAEAVRTHADGKIARTRLVGVGYPGKSHVDLWAAGVDGFIYRPPHEHDLLREVEAALARADDALESYRANELERARTTAGPHGT